MWKSCGFTFAKTGKYNLINDLVAGSQPNEGREANTAPQSAQDARYWG